MPLTWDEPHLPPPGTAFYFREYFGCEGSQVWHRTIATETGDLLWDDPLSELPRESEEADWDAQLEGVSTSGRTLVAWVCRHGPCVEGIDGYWSEDAVQSLWGSSDRGVSWERWGEYPAGEILRVSAVTEDDAAVYSYSGPDNEFRAWWFRSGEAIVHPTGLDAKGISGWRRTPDGLDPIWRAGEGTKPGSSSGDYPAMPPGFEFAAGLPDGSILWSQVAYRDERWSPKPGARDLFLHVDGQSAILGAYSWDGPTSLVLVDHVDGHLFAGFLGTYACGDIFETILVDFSSSTVHAVPGIDAKRNFVFFAAGAAPE